LKHQFFDNFQLVPLNYYGLTETTGICLSEDPENYHLDQNTIGVPRACIAQIVDLDGKIVAPGEQGLLRIYSENNMLGYFKNEEKTHEMIKNGWLYTGDIARWLKNNHIELFGRTRDIIKIATGQLVFASEIENSLLACKQLISAAAVGAINSDEGEKIIAFISLNQGVETEESNIKEQLKKHLSEQIGFRKTPALWVFLDQLPVSANGKVLKSELLEKYRNLNG
jgi:acyl-coenzyme A synthetase/AMP-(fatty) acid ligase